MNLSLSGLLPHLLWKFKSESELIQAILEISQKFTTERTKIEDYLKDPRLVSAYTAFYLLTNMPKLKSVLNWMPQDWVKELVECDFIDLGAGPGTFSLAFKEFGSRGDFFQIEKSPLMREQARLIWNGLYQQTLEQDSEWRYKTKRPVFLLFGHSANEMGPELACEYLEKISPDHVLFIEPGTKDFFPTMLKLRHFLLEKKYQLLYPCPQSSACPMEKSTTDWCHQFIHVKQDPEIERLSQMCRLDRKLMPLTVGAYSKKAYGAISYERIVRILPGTKFSFEWDVCHNNNLERYQLMKKDYSKQDLKLLERLTSGEAIASTLVKNFENFKRVKINKT